MSVKTFALSTIAALSLAAAAAMPAAAQSAMVDVRGSQPLAAWNTTAERANGLDVLGPNGAKIGMVDTIVGDDASTPTMAVVEFIGVEGYRAGKTAIPLEQFTLADGILSLRTNASELAAMPAYNS